MNKLTDKYNIVFIILIFIYFFSRLFNLGKLPIYNDEAMYINWGRLIIKNFNENIFISLTDGQQPLYIWLTAISYWINPVNFLTSARFVSVISGLGNLFVIWLIGKELFNKKIGIFASLLYIIIPFTLWYDRIAIKDSLLMFLCGLVIYFTIKQSKTKSFKYSAVVGISLGLALLNKSISYFFVGLYPLTLVLLSIQLNAKSTGQHNQPILRNIEITKLANNIKNEILKNIGFLLTTIIIALIIQSIMNISPLISNIGPKNSVFLLSFAEILDFPISLWRNNIYSTINWFIQYYSLPVLIITILGLIALFKNRTFLAIMLFAWIILPITFEVFTAKIFIPRYFLFTFIPISIITSYGLYIITKYIKKTPMQFSLVLFILLPSIKLDSQILFNTNNAKLPQIEQWQYLKGWPSGYGLEELAIYLKSQYLYKSAKITIITEEETLVSSGLPLFLTDYHNWDIIRVFPLGKSLPELNSNIIDPKQSTLIIIHHNQIIPEKWKVKEVKRIPRGNPNEYFLVYEVLK